MDNQQQPGNWQDILQRMADIRETGDYSTANIEFIHEQLSSNDDRIRGGAALAAEGCIFESQILDILIDMAENDRTSPVRKAVLLSLGQVIQEGVKRQYEKETGPDTNIEFYEEWDELQNQALQEEYFQVKNILYSIIQDDLEELMIREACLSSLSDLGFLTEVQDWVNDFSDYSEESSKIVALKAMGKFPQYWISKLAEYLNEKQSKPILMEAISSSFSSNSNKLASKIEKLLHSDDPDILAYSILTLTNIHATENLGEIIQTFTYHENEKVRNAAKEAIVIYSQKSFDDYMINEIGFDE
jgi:HEAT repeat protein